MINKINALSAFARVMLSGAVVALSMAAPSAVLAQDQYPLDFEWCTSGQNDPTNEIWWFYQGACEDNTSTGFGDFSVSISPTGEAHAFYDPMLFVDTLDFYCWGSGSLEFVVNPYVSTILDCNTYTHYVFDIPSGIETIDIYGINTNSGDVFIDGEPVINIVADFDAATSLGWPGMWSRSLGRSLQF